MITAYNISFSPGGKQILKDISFNAQQGEVLAILGSNGAGKSSLIKILSGQLKQSKGTVGIGGRLLTEWGAGDLARIRAVLEQQTRLSLPFEVKDIVMMGRYPHLDKASSKQHEIIVSNALHKAGITHLASRNYLSLSGGEQQRVQLARVFAQIWYPPHTCTKYLLMDEPVNSLDVLHQHTTLQLAQAFAREGNCVITVLHDLNLAMQYADKILLLKNGQMISTGTVNSIINDKVISEMYGIPLRIIHHPSYLHPVVIPSLP